VPSAKLVQSNVFAFGWQLWHPSEFFTSVATDAEAIQQPVEQLPAKHTFPGPQLLPSARTVQLEVVTDGWQLWQAFAELAAPLG